MSLKHAFAVLTLLLLGASSMAQSNSRRQYRIGVLVPEQLLQRVVPDPAVETKLRGALIDAEFKVIDLPQAERLTQYKVVDRIMDGGPDAVKEAVRIARQMGVDILVVGEAFAQEVARTTQETELGTVTQIRCRARLELRAYLVDTAEVIFSDSIQQTGPPDLTVELASKLCFETVAEDLAPKLLEKLEKLPNPTWTRMQVEVRGLKMSAATEMREAFKLLPGFIAVEDMRYESSIATFEIKLSVGLQKDMAAKLEMSPKFKKFKLEVQTATSTSIVAFVKKD